jgi:flavodoxin
MKTLVVFYSRTGTTKRVGEAIAQKLNAEMEEIKDTIDRSGAKGYLISGRDAMRRKLTQLEPFKSNLNDYDLIIIGTPVWGWNMSAPVRTFITEQKDNLKKVALFCTLGGSGDKRTFLEMEEIIGKKPETTLKLLTKEVAENNFSSAVEKFADDLKIFKNN